MNIQQCKSLVMLSLEEQGQKMDNWVSVSQRQIDVIENGGKKKQLKKGEKKGGFKESY